MSLRGQSFALGPVNWVGGGGQISRTCTYMVAMRLMDSPCELLAYPVLHSPTFSKIVAPHPGCHADLCRSGFSLGLGGCFIVETLYAQMNTRCQAKSFSLTFYIQVCLSYSHESTCSILKGQARIRICLCHPIRYPTTNGMANCQRQGDSKPRKR